MKPAPTEPRASRLYTAQEVARFCEVDLKTIHNYVGSGKIPHHRTEGRHLRFRRNDLVAFLRTHGYPLPDAITSARPLVFFALGDAPSDVPMGAAPVEGVSSHDDVVKKLASRFAVRRFSTAATAVAHLISGEPDALVCALDDPTWAGDETIAALDADPATSWIAFVGISTASPPSAADLVLPPADLPRLVHDLSKLLALS